MKKAILTTRLKRVRSCFFVLCALTLPSQAMARQFCALTPEFPPSALMFNAVATSNDLTRKPGALERATGHYIRIKGVVRDEACVPVTNVIVQMWQTDPRGHYAKEYLSDSELIDRGETQNPNFAYSGTAITNNLGEYSFITLLPSSMSADSAPHINVKIHHDHFEGLETRMYFANHPRNQKDDKLQDFLTEPLEIEVKSKKKEATPSIKVPDITPLASPSTEESTPAESLPAQEVLNSTEDGIPTDDISNEEITKEETAIEQEFKEDVKEDVEEGIGEILGEDDSDIKAFFGEGDEDLPLSLDDADSEPALGGVPNQTQGVAAVVKAPTPAVKAAQKAAALKRERKKALKKKEEDARKALINDNDHPATSRQWRENRQTIFMTKLPTPDDLPENIRLRTYQFDMVLDGLSRYRRF